MGWFETREKKKQKKQKGSKIRGKVISKKFPQKNEL